MTTPVKPALVAGGVIFALLVPASAESSLPGRCSGVMGIAHRGTTVQGHTENTIASFTDALKLGADAVETDVAITKDGRFMLMHDPTLDRTTTGTGRISNRISGYVRNHRTNDGGRVPFLRGALATVRRAGGRMFLEMKRSPYWNQAKVEQFTNTIKAERMGANVVVVAPRSLLPMMNTAAPQMQTSWKDPAVLTAKFIRRYADGAVTSRLRAINVQGMHRAGLKVWARHADTKPRWQRSVERHMDGIYTDHIIALVKWCRTG
ncbi:MAG: glycerophosphodiester phosphodiesterase family protein [Nocardioidaceae bacterium]